MPEITRDPQPKAEKSGQEWTLLGILAAGLTFVLGVAAFLYCREARGTVASMDDFFVEGRRVDYLPEFILFGVAIGGFASSSCILLLGSERLSWEIEHLTNSGSGSGLLLVAMRTLALYSFVFVLLLWPIETNTPMLRWLPLLGIYETLIFLANLLALPVAVVRKKWRIAVLLGFNSFMLSGALFLPVF